MEQIPPSSVTILGAGLSGLVCARILQQNGVHVTVHERDTSRSERPQGGSLDIHFDTGQPALAEAGLLDAFRARVHAGGEALRVLDKAGTVFLDEKDTGDGGRPEIDRSALRDLLLDSLAPGTVHWGRRAVRVEAGPRPRVVFADGGTVTADVLVGADGAWSRTRAALTPAVPHYTGITIVELHLDDAPTRHPEAMRLVGQGSLFALSDEKSIGGHGSEHIWLGLGLRVDEDWHRGIDWADTEGARQELLRHYADWSPELTRLIRDADPVMTPRPIHALPAGFTWSRHPRITLIGDAAHLMSPFAGEGANIALTDGADLARALMGIPDPAEAIRDYEERMRPRAASAAEASAAGLDLIFSPTAPKELVEFFSSVRPS
jgi:2-polyprenyl-6-methoxyphenol hydroxylase-like FAD-dependent oxidoreductase